MRIIGNIIKTAFIRMKLKKKNVQISLLSFFDSKCEFEDNIFIDRFNVIHMSKIGRYSYITNNCEIANCEIGRFCSIASGVKIGLGNHPTHLFSTSPVFYSYNNKFGVKWVDNLDINVSKKTIIGSDVWIGANALIKDGIVICDGSVIGAGAIVTKDVEPYSIIGGNPARLIRKRFDDETIKKLLCSEWWKLDEIELYKNSKFFGDYNLFLDNAMVVRKN